MIQSQNLTVGNTVTASVALYKNQWREFLKLSAIAHLWLLVPIYGWARHLAIAAWISQLSLQKLNNDLEFNSQEKYFSIRSLGIFFIVAVLASIVPFILSFLVIIILIYAWLYLEQMVSPTILASIFNLIEENVPKSIFSWIIVISLYLIASWFHVRFFLTDLVFTIEKKLRIFTIIKQSYLLTKNNSFKIFMIIGLSLLVISPIWLTIYFLISIFLTSILTILNNVVPNLLKSDSIYVAVFYLICWTSIVNLLVMPFWRSLKAVTFYRLTQLDNWDLSHRPN